MSKEQPETVHELRDPIVPPVKGSTNDVTQTVPRGPAKPQFFTPCGE